MRPVFIDRLLSAAIVILAAVFLVGLYIVLIAPPKEISSGRPMTSQPHSPIRTPPPVTEAELEALWGAQKAGSLASPAPAAPASALPPSPPKPAPLPLKLRGVIYSTAGSSVAFIETQERLAFYRLHDMVNGWRITAIDMFSVTLRRDGEERHLSIEGRVYGDSPRVAASSPATSTRRRVAQPPKALLSTGTYRDAKGNPVERRVEIVSSVSHRSTPPPRDADATVAVMPHVAEQLRQNPASAIEGVQIEPLMKEGKMNGLAIRNVAPGSLAARYGLAPGDKIIAVNGHSIDSPGRVFELYEQYRNSNSVRVTLERNGTRREVVYYIQ